VDESRKFKSTEELKTLMHAKDSSPVVTYCHIGQQATVLYFTARYLGLDAKLYDGSFQDWSSRPELPLQ
jgi:thiosulfate/3-mercaptopyruvate sulfurtransferase